MRPRMTVEQLRKRFDDAREAFTSGVAADPKLVNEYTGLDAEQTLTEALRSAGYSHRPAERCAITGAHDIFDDQGMLVFTGQAHETWYWLSNGR